MASYAAVTLTAALLLSSPSPFYFGVSTAAFQVEGEPADSDWRRWTETRFDDSTPHIEDSSHAASVTGFWRRYDEDFAIAQQSGMNAFRISIAWERVQPAPNVWDDAALQRYVDMIVAMRRRGLEPFVTLQHFVLPGWLADRGGLLAEEYPQRFADYCQHVAQVLAQPPTQVRYFMTLNEPNLHARSAYLENDRFPPGLHDPAKTLQALAALAEAHVLGHDRLHAVGNRLVVGYAHSWHVYRPSHPNNPADRAARDAYHASINTQFVDAVRSGRLFFSLPGGPSYERQVPLPRGPALDFLGVQNYGRLFVGASEAPEGFVLENGTGPRSDLNWEVVPDALFLALEEAASYGVPLLVSETGLADQHDVLRGRYLQDNFASIQRALRQKIPLFGYLHWSLTDNFEWGHGLWPRFGLVEIDYEQNAKRTPRASLRVYQELIASFASSYDALH